MARKTAMGKEPGSVSIAIPKGKFQPGKPEMFDGNTGAVKQPKQELKRVSPGVYRNAGGQLVGSKGQQLPRQPQQQARGQMEGVAQEIMRGAQQPQQGGQIPDNSQITPEMQQTLQSIMNQGQMNQTFNPQMMQQIMQGSMPGIQSGMLEYPGGRPMPVNDFMLRYPAGQAPNLGALFNAGQRQQEQQQQPNSVSGLLQRRFR